MNKYLKKFITAVYNYFIALYLILMCSVCASLLAMFLPYINRVYIEKWLDFLGLQIIKNIFIEDKEKGKK